MDQASYFKYDTPFVTMERCPHCGRPWEGSRYVPFLQYKDPAGDYWRYSKGVENSDLSLRDEHELFYAKRMNRGVPYFQYDAPAEECRPGFKSVEPRSIPFFEYDAPAEECQPGFKSVEPRSIPFFEYDAPAGECRPGFKSVEPKSIPFFEYDQPTGKCWRCSREVKHSGMSACDDCALLKAKNEKQRE